MTAQEIQQQNKIELTEKIRKYNLTDPMAVKDSGVYTDKPSNFPKVHLGTILKYTHQKKLRTTFYFHYIFLAVQINDQTILKYECPA